MIKKAARELFETVPEFSEDFVNNKKLLTGTIHFKSMRNKVAGGIIRLVQKQKAEQERKNIKEEIIVEEDKIEQYNL